MPFTQNAPCEPGCSAFGAILITLPSWMVRNEPHSALHSQHVLGTISVGDRFDGRTFIATSSGAAKAIRVHRVHKGHLAGLRLLQHPRRFRLPNFTPNSRSPFALR